MTRHFTPWHFKVVAFTIFALACLAGTLLAQPVPPTKLSGVPIYKKNQIELEWRHDGAMATSFEIERKEAGGAFAQVGTTNAATKKFLDTNGLATDKEYFYRVRAVGAAGPSAYTPEFQQNLKVVWPTPASDEMLHGWNDTIGTAGVAIDGKVNGFHEGVDHQRPDGGSHVKVLALRGGRVRAAGTGANSSVSIEVRYGDTTEYDEFYHLANGVTVKENDAVRAGEQIGEISEDHFGVDFTDHTHMAFAKSKFGDVIEWHPLQIYLANKEKDPKEKKPALADHAGTPAGSLLWRPHGSAAAPTPYDPTKPLSGDVDLIVEVADEMGTLPDQNPNRLGYWILPNESIGNRSANGVKSRAEPYMLFDYTRAWFGKGQADLKLHNKVVFEGQDHGPNIKSGTETYPWQNFKHYIVTNAKDVTGKVGDVDDGQYWNTNAKEDSPSPDQRLNYAGKPDTTKTKEARFRDGTYILVVMGSDLVNGNVDLSSADPKFNLRLENFPPIVLEARPHGDIDSPTLSEGFNVIFSEIMDTSIAANTLVSIDNGATIANAQWLDWKLSIAFTATNLKHKTRYTVTISGNAKDQPGTPGGRQLDGNEDGVGGDPYKLHFFVK